MPEEEAAIEILSSSASRLCLDMRYLTEAVLSLNREVSPGIGLPRCDGKTVVFRTDSVIADYRSDPCIVSRRLAHCILHCVLGHTAAGRDEQLAQDMIAEYVMDSLDPPSVSVPGRDDRMYACEKLFKRAGGPVSSLMAPEIASLSTWQRSLYERMFVLDDDTAHPIEDDGRWKEISQQIMVELEGFVRDPNVHSDALVSILRIRNARRQDHRAFLRRFMSRRPAVKENLEEFDPVYYSYGLQTYGNIPLVDSLETSDSPRVESLVIAVDTSGSTMKGPVEAFIEEAFSMLGQAGMGRSTCVHIVQCDEIVRHDDVVTSEGDLRRLMSSFELEGGGGTDFRPVFTYVDRLIDEGRLVHLRGLLYFTDGMGTFPDRRPRYDTAFVFCDEGCREHSVPPWAMKLEIRTSDLTKKGSE